MILLRDCIAICGALTLTLAAFGQEPDEATQDLFQKRQIVPGGDLSVNSCDPSDLQSGACGGEGSAAGITGKAGAPRVNQLSRSPNVTTNPLARTRNLEDSQYRKVVEPPTEFQMFVEDSVCALQDAVRICSMLSVDDSHPVPATRLAVPKLPFVADATLLAVALGVWMTGGAVGAAPVVLPRLGRARRGDHGDAFRARSFSPGQLAILAGGGAGGGSAVGAEGEWRRQAQAAAEAVEHAARANAALENSARRFLDDRFAPLMEVHKGLEAAVAELREVIGRPRRGGRRRGAGHHAGIRTPPEGPRRKNLKPPSLKSPRWKTPSASLPRISGLFCPSPSAPVASVPVSAPARVREVARVEIQRLCRPRHRFWSPPAARRWNPASRPILGPGRGICARSRGGAHPRRRAGGGKNTGGANDDVSNT